ncbi:MAG: DNA-3-methyladenine glycosylase [Ilumatobacter sp.]|uniref:DNA-3-methyladenine glycosylase n=1 Tax=Ilumatobacter sp. TaxID=1967498 RepID=UPI003C746D45
MDRTLDREWFESDAPLLAPQLLNKLLVADIDGVICSGRIIETEAYMPDDPASHTYRGETKRNTVMFGSPGHLYVYLSYGIHQCANVVTGPVGSGQGVLIRAVEPVEGIDAMRVRRNRPDRELANGPGKLCQALGIGDRHNGADLLGSDVAIVDDGLAPPSVPLVGPRIGISRATTTPWRFRRPSD